MSVKLGRQIPLVTRGLVSLYDVANTSNYLLSSVEVLVVAGGGSGGNCKDNSGTPGSGGGGGGVLYSSSYTVSPGSAITVTVGNGGAAQNLAQKAGNNGQNSVFGNLIATGGGGGGGDDTSSPYGSGTDTRRRGNNGGSGGGSGNSTTDRTTGISGQGFGGGGSTDGAGGGGGAGESGADSPYMDVSGKGGNGIVYNISGSPVYYGGGGGGGGYSSLLAGPGGLGGGGLGARQQATTSDGQNGTDGLGGGGGGGAANQGLQSNGGAGGKGVVIIRYLGPQKATGGDTIIMAGGHTIHTFTNSGTFTPFSSIPANSGTVYGLRDLYGSSSARAVNTPTYSTSSGGLFQFNGTNNYLRVANSSQTGNFTNELTVQIWCSSTYPDNGYRCPIMKTTSGAWNDGWGFYQVSDNLHFFINQWNGAQRVTVPKTSFNLTCFTAVYDSVNIKLYENGVLSTTGSSFTSQIVNTRSNMNIAAGGGDGYFWSGNIGQVAIYEQALTATEVLQNYTATRTRFNI